MKNDNWILTFPFAMLIIALMTQLNWVEVVGKTENTCDLFCEVTNYDL